jgi:FKBP-type peptidyl-prolyl cis-trans isomerase FkpA
MTEITRVPLLPIAKGALPKLWIGIAAVALVAGGIAWAAMPPQVEIETLTPGKGPSPKRDDVALVNYKGTLADGTVFDEGQQAVFPLSEVVPGFTKALEQMQKEGKYKIEIPSELAYGDKQMGAIPADSDLTFEIELLDFRSRAEIEQQRQMIEQMQQMQGGAPPHGAMPPQR